MKCTYYLLLILIAVINYQPNIYASTKIPSDEVLVTLLSKHIDESVFQYYSKEKAYDLWDAKIIDIHNNSTTKFTVKINIHTYERAHDEPFGNDTITFVITPKNVINTNFEHIPVYEKPHGEFHES